MDLGSTYDLPFRELAGKYADAYADSPNHQEFRAILDARVAEAQAASARAQVATAKWTRRLVIATFVLALGTIAFATGSYLAQRDTAAEAKKQTCIADASLSAAIGAVDAGATDDDQMRQSIVEQLVGLQKACE